MDASINLLMNLLIMLIVTIGHQFWIESKPNHPFNNKYFTMFSAGLLIFFSMFVSFHEVNGVQYDLRRLPFWFGTLYGGPIVGTVLAIETIALKGFIGGSGFIASAVTTICLLFVTLMVRNVYFQLLPVGKVILSAVINVLFSIFVLTLYSLENIPLNNMQNMMSFVLTNLVGILLVSFSIVAIQHNYRVRMQLIQTEKLEVISHLAAAVNDQVKNPLTTIRGMMQLLRRDENLSIEKREMYISLALNEIDHIDKITSDYLMFARPYPNELKSLNVKDLLTESFRMIEQAAEQRNVIFKNEVFSNFHILGDQAHMLKVLVNIMKNSLDAMPSGGTLSVAVTAKDRYCLIHIKDDGMGMDRETVDRLGEPYFSMTTEGVGLGMMVVFKVVASMDGEITVKSEPGKGTEVILSLPLL